MASLSINDLHGELVTACKSGDLDALLKLMYYYKSKVGKLIKGDVAFTHKTKFGAFKPGEYIFIACEHNHPEIVKQLIALGANTTEAHHSHLTPVLVACQKGSVEVLRVLHSHNIEIHSDDVEFENSPIYHCCQYGQTEVLSFIVEVVPGILLKTVNGGIGQSPGLEYADIWAGLTKASKSGSGLLIGNLLLYVGCILKHLSIVKFLINKGIGVNDIVPAQTFYSAMQSPLSAACRNNDYDMAHFLLLQKAEITSSIANQYPEFTALLLQDNVKKYRRSYSVRERSKVKELPTANPFAVYWESKGLHQLHRHWIEVHSENLCLLDVHDNKIITLPLDFFELLPHLEDLDLSCNNLSILPSRGLLNSKLTRLLACRNNLLAVPIELFLNKNIVIIDLSQNKLKYLPPDTESNLDEFNNNSDPTIWECTSLKLLKCSNNILCCLPKAIYGAVMLEKLILTNNMLTTFSATWRCPMIELDLSQNQLNEFTTMSQMVWSKTLQRLNLSNNNLKSLSSNISHLQCLQHLDMSYNVLQTLPPPSIWKCKVLNKLNLSHNMLTASCGPDGFFGVDKNRVASAIYGNIPSFISNCEFPVDLLVNCLQSLDLSYNQLEMVPESLCCLNTLSELDLSCNPPLRSIPAELGNLKNIWNLRLNELNLPDLPFELNGKNSAKSVLPYLRAKLRKSVPFNRIKLMVVGLQGRGKTTLIATLQGKKPPPNISTVGISVEQWSLSSPTSKSYSFFKDHNEPKDILFSSWDLAGQHVYYATHQCFLTGKTLYLAVFNTTHGQEGIDSLGPWLLNVQARAPSSRVIVVGTHIDSIPATNRKSVLERIEKEILYKYDRKGFPIISGCSFVSNISGEGLPFLRDKIYSVAEKMNYNNSSGLPTTGKLAPLSYIELYDSIVKESLRRKEFQLPPVLTMDDMLLLARMNKNNDIYDIEELILAAKFLHEHGILLHFNDHLRELNTLFFIDPSWLCEMLSLVVTVRERNPYVKGGYIKQNELMLVLRNPRLPEKFIPQYLRLLERFEISLSIDDNTFLIPSMLPTKRPVLALEEAVAKYDQCIDLNLETEEKSKNWYISRNYHMHYIPSGFWSRLIARLTIAVHKWGMIIAGNASSEKSEKSDKRHSIDDEKYSLVFWREGILVYYDDGYFLVESFNDEVTYEYYSNKGVTITVWSNVQDFSVMGFIVDHLDMLITEWYPGLEDVDECGMPLIEKLIPCPLCSMKRQKELKEIDSMKSSLNASAYFRDPNHVEQFDLQVCALAATNYQSILCSKHSTQPVLLKMVVPDLLLSDLPSHLVIDPEAFEFEPSDLTRLGEGGAGGVYRGMYKQIDVAVKQFHSATKTKYFDNTDGEMNFGNIKGMFVPTAQTIQDQIEDGKVIRAFWDLRQEVAVLCRLQHPNVIQFIGVCHSPLCFALELAPMGSLQTILEDLQVKRDEKYAGVPTANMCVGAVLGRIVTHKIALQVAMALSYLHELEIIYRDLKSDNVLVWSLSKDDVVNVKISDYGISAFATPQGVIGEGGTPGFQAPEIKVGCAYDEKVDIFSFGIWLYELVSGYRPYREYRTAAEMKKAVARGIRPNLRKDGIYPCMPHLELLMEECWQSNPILRPSSDDIHSQLSDVNVIVVENTYPQLESSELERITCVTLWLNKEDQKNVEEQSERIHLLAFCDQESERRFKILDIAKETVVNDSVCPGPRVLCAVQVDYFLWLGTEGKQIEVFGCACSTVPKVLWTIPVKDHVMHMLTSNGENNSTTRVYASLVNGTLVVFTKKNDICKDENLLFNEEFDDKLHNEQEKWSKPLVINLATQGLPAKCMTFTRNNEELWVGSGNIIVILSTKTLEVVSQIKALYGTRSLISFMASDNEFVWLSDRKNSVITQWNVKTHKKVHKFQCNLENPLHRNIIINTENVLNTSFEEDDKKNSDSSFKEIGISEMDFASEEQKVDKQQSEHHTDKVLTEETENHQVSSSNHALSPAHSTYKEEQGTLSPKKNTVEKSPTFPRSRGFTGLIDSLKDVVKRKSLDPTSWVVSNNPVFTGNIPQDTPQEDGRKVRSFSEESPSSPPRHISFSSENKQGDDYQDILSPSNLIKRLTIRKQPSLMFSKSSLKQLEKKRSSSDHEIILEVKENAVSRPRASAWSGNLDRVTAILNIDGLLWVGRASGDILVININKRNVHDDETEESKCGEDKLLHNYGNVVAILGRQLRDSSNCSRTISNLVLLNPRMVLSLVRMEPKQQRSHSISTSTRHISTRQSAGFDKFQTVLMHAWNLNEFEEFEKRIKSSKIISAVADETVKDIKNVLDFT